MSALLIWLTLYIPFSGLSCHLVIVATGGSQHRDHCWGVCIPSPSLKVNIAAPGHFSQKLFMSFSFSSISALCWIQQLIFRMPPRVYEELKTLL